MHFCTVFKVTVPSGTVFYYHFEFYSKDGRTVRSKNGAEFSVA